MSVVRRMPRYYRFLGDLLAGGVSRISSRELSERMGVTASQIRQDLNSFGGFGQQGYGYNVEMLHAEIGKILGLDKRYPVILVGVGNLGRAIAAHIDFGRRGYRLIGAFDHDAGIVGRMVGGVEVRHTDEIEAFCTAHRPAVAVLCIPKQAAKGLVDRLVRLGVTGFWNFSHYDILMDYPDVVAENVHLGDSLMTLCYKVKELEQEA